MQCLLRQRAPEAEYVHQTENDQHQANRKLHAEAHTRRDYEVKENNCGADSENRQCMAETPERPDRRGLQYAALPADDGRHRDDMIGIGGVPHPEKESQRDDGEQVDQAGQP